MNLIQYIDALGDFPQKADVIRLEGGKAQLIKTDIFKGIMYYSIQKENFKGPLIALSKEKVKQLIELNKKGKLIDDLASLEIEQTAPVSDDDDMENIELDFADVTGEIELPDVKRRRKKRRPKRKPQNRQNKRGGNKQNQKKNPQSGNQNKDKGNAESNKNKPQGRSNNRRKKRNNRNNNNSKNTEK